MPTSHLTGLDKCNLHRRTPYGMTAASKSQLSIARDYGSCKYNGEDYTYFPETDELVRDDVLKWRKKQEKPKKHTKP